MNGRDQEGLSVVVGRASGTVVVTVRGVIDADSCALLRRILRDLVDDQGNLDVVLDVAEVGTAASPPELVALVNEVGASLGGGRWRVVRASPARPGPPAMRDGRLHART